MKAKSLDDGSWYAVKKASLKRLKPSLKLKEVKVWERVSPHPGITRFVRAWQEDVRSFFN
jgi:hypothetical protein